MLALAMQLTRHLQYQPALSMLAFSRTVLQGADHYPLAFVSISMQVTRLQGATVSDSIGLASIFLLTHNALS